MFEVGDMSIYIYNWVLKSKIKAVRLTRGKSIPQFVRCFVGYKIDV